jgi:D-glycero-D-manno-heptose 1,7-bisphosphate phosphatase
MKHYLFDLDGTIIRSYMERSDKDFHAVELLPGVLEAWKHLRWDTGNNMAIVSNQGGVAFGYNSESDVIEKFKAVARALGYGHIEVHSGTGEPMQDWSGSRHTEGVLTFYVCYADARSSDPCYNDPARVARRKPSPAMIYEAMEMGEGEPVFIGDRPEDEQAARAAGVDFVWAQEFFRG